MIDRFVVIVKDKITCSIFGPGHNDIFLKMWAHHCSSSKVAIGLIFFKLFVNVCKSPNLLAYASSIMSRRAIDIQAKYISLMLKDISHFHGQILGLPKLQLIFIKTPT